MPDLDTTTPLVSDPTLDAVSALIMGEEPSTENAVAQAEMPAPTDPAAEAEKPEEAAPEAPEKDALDYGMKVPMTGGEPVTLGELKDHYQNHQAALLAVQDRENAILRQTQDVEQLMAFLDQLPPGAVDVAKQRRVDMYQHEMAKLSKAIPEIGTAEGAREVVKVLAEAAKDYGISEAELKQVMDSRYIKWMYDAARQAKAVREARNNVKPLRSDQPKAQHAANSSEIDISIGKAKQTGSQADVLRAVDALIRSA